MDDDQNIIEYQDNQDIQDAGNALVPLNIEILVTDEDKTGSDITAMSNFTNGYIERLSTDLSNGPFVERVIDLPIANLGILNDVISYAEVSLQSDYSLLPDFEHLPDDVKEKLKDGTYKIGDSRQVDGNLRAVIVDEAGERKKDITLKTVKNCKDTSDITRSLTQQLQMRQLAVKLDNIQALQDYQLDRDRDRDIKTPILNARDYILLAQESESLEEQKKYLEDANRELTAGINGIYTDIDSTASHLVKETSRPIFQRDALKKRFMKNLTDDLQVATRFVGMQMQVLDYLGNPAGSKQVIDRFQHKLSDFFIKGVNKNGESLAMIMHNYFPYNNENKNDWYYLAEDIKPSLKARTLLEDKPIYIVSVEDIDDAKEEE